MSAGDKAWIVPLTVAMFGCAPTERIGLYTTTVDAGPNDVPDKVGTFDNAGDCAEAAARLKSASAETWVYYCAEDTPEE